MKLWENGSTVPRPVLSVDSHGSREVNFVEICGRELLQKYIEGELRRNIWQVNFVHIYGRGLLWKYMGGDFFENILR